jgi:hypothetical protein
MTLGWGSPGPGCRHSCRTRIGRGRISGSSAPPSKPGWPEPSDRVLALRLPLAGCRRATTEAGHARFTSTSQRKLLASGTRSFVTFVRASGCDSQQAVRKTGWKDAVDRRDTASVVEERSPDRRAIADGCERHLHAAPVPPVLHHPLDPEFVRGPHPTISPRTVKRWLVLADVTAGLVGLGVAFTAQRLWWPVEVGVARIQWLLLVASVPFWFASALVNHLHAARSNLRRFHEFKHIVGTAAMGVASMIGLSFLLQQSEFGRRWAFTVFVAVVIAVTIERQIARSVFRRLRRTGRLSRPILVIAPTRMPPHWFARSSSNPNWATAPSDSLRPGPPKLSCTVSLWSETCRTSRMRQPNMERREC